MAINTVEFLIFALAVCIIYFIAPKKVKWVVLLIASYIYYYISSKQLTIFLIITTISIYLLALGLDKIDSETKSKCKGLEKEEKKKLKNKAEKNKKWLVFFSILINFGILLVLKYGNFFSGNFNFILSKLNIDFQISEFNFILPLGISYYTLQATSYVIDVYRGKYKADRNLGRVALFTSFFPQMVEGPIGRYDDLAHQLYEPHKFDYNNAKYGIQLMVWGFFKKMVIADRAGIFVNNVFASYSQYNGIVILLAIILYTIQIYAEFSGCIDIVRGLAQVLGINMAENFRRPFFSKSVQEFWRRWHITLGTWLKDYVFYPVSFSKITLKIAGWAKKKEAAFLAKFIPAAFALFFVWFGNGLWHGASWKYILYGLYYYVIMMLGLLCEPLFTKIIEKLKINVEANWYKLMQMIRTTIFVLIGMLIFRAKTFGEACQIFKSIFNMSNIGIIFNKQFYKLGLSARDFVVIGIGVLIMLIVGILQEKGIVLREKISKKNIIIRWILYYGIMFSILIFGIYGKGYVATNFIYGQF